MSAPVNAEEAPETPHQISAEEVLQTLNSVQGDPNRPDDEVVQLRRKISKIMSVLNEKGGVVGDEAGVLERVRELAASASQSAQAAFAAGVTQPQPDALPPTPKRHDDEERQQTPSQYTQAQSTAHAVPLSATSPTSANQAHPRFQFFYPPGNLPGPLFAVPQPTSTGVGAFPLLVAAAVAAQPAPIQPGPAPEREDNGMSSIKRKRRPTKVYSCTFPGCTRQFTRHFNLQTHMKTHDPNRDKPFSCELCDKAFGRKVDRDRHMNVHTKEKTHVCPYCSKTFTRKDALQRHVTARRCGPVVPGLGAVFGGIPLPSIRMIGDVDGGVQEHDGDAVGRNGGMPAPGTPTPSGVAGNVNGQWVLLPMGNMMPNGQNMREGMVGNVMNNGMGGMVLGQRIQMEDGGRDQPDGHPQLRIMEVREGDEEKHMHRHPTPQDMGINHDDRHTLAQQSANVAEAAHHAVLAYQQAGAQDAGNAMLAYQQHQQNAREAQQGRPDDGNQLPLEMRAGAIQFSLQ